MNIAVIGTGTLGPGITQVFIQSDITDRVFLCKGRKESVRDGRQSIIDAYGKMLQRGRITREDVERFLGKVETGDLELSSKADFLIEAVSEDLTVKQTIFRRLDSICRPDCIFATNTSSLPIRSIGEGLSRPLIGMHFFNPAPVMKLVEVIITDQTPREIADRVMQLARDIGKRPVEVRESPGFIVNRVLIPMINEAIGIYAEGVSSVEDIDTALKLGANLPMGPLELGDLIGLDIVLAILNVMLKETGDVRYLPQAILKKMVREGKLGRKTGIGFYKYS